MRTVTAYPATSATEPLTRGTVERRDVGEHDVYIDIAYSGICHTDLHTVRGDWGPVEYPLTVGHEIAGTVGQVGSAVTRHTVGDRVGVGCMVDSCGDCVNCLDGEEQYCHQVPTLTYGSQDADGTITQGGFATGIVVKEDFVVHIPDAIPLEKAAPLLCAGITTYSPLMHWKVGPGTKVAVVGLGGLGHMGVQIAHALGAEVTVLSQTLRKKDDGLRFGADHYFATSDPATFVSLARNFDLILSAISSNFDVESYLGLLRRDGSLVVIGDPELTLPVHVLTLFRDRRSVAGSTIGGIRETQEMLDFCAEHNVAPEVEVVSVDSINEAFDRLARGDVRYRFVIDVATFGS